MVWSIIFFQILSASIRIHCIPSNLHAVASQAEHDDGVFSYLVKLFLIFNSLSETRFHATLSRQMRI